MTVAEIIKDEKVQFDFNREAAKIFALSSNNIYNFKNFTGEEILPPDQSVLTEQAGFKKHLKNI